MIGKTELNHQKPDSERQRVYNLLAMEITFHDPSQRPLPPSEIRICSVIAEPWPDGRRVSVVVQLTPFQQRPNLHTTIRDAQGQEVVSAGVMQVRETQIAFTLHLRQPKTMGKYSVSAYLTYPDLDLEIVDQAETTLKIPKDAPR